MVGIRSFPFGGVGPGLFSGAFAVSFRECIEILWHQKSQKRDTNPGIFGPTSRIVVLNLLRHAIAFPAPQAESPENATLGIQTVHFAK